MRRILSFIDPAGQPKGNRIERSCSCPMGMDIAKELTEVLWSEGAGEHLREDTIEPSRTTKGLFVRPVTCDPNWDARLLKRFGQKLHLRELIMRSLVADLLPAPELRQDLKTLIEH